MQTDPLEDLPKYSSKYFLATRYPVPKNSILNRALKVNHFFENMWKLYKTFFFFFACIDDEKVFKIMKCRKNDAVTSFSKSRLFLLGQCQYAYDFPNLSLTLCFQCTSK